MLRYLLESAPTRPRTRSAAFISFAFHAALVGSAVAATAMGPVDEDVPVLPTTPLHYIPTPEQAPIARAPRAPRPAAPRAPSPVDPIVAPVDVPSTLPPVPEPGTVAMDPWTTLPGPVGTPDGTGDVGAPSGSDGDPGFMWPEDVERHAKPLGAVRQPRYPEPLRSQRLEGSVRASYIVDTLGRVEPASFKAREATHPLFEQAVRSALMSQRFRPAQWNGKRVRQLVEQQFVFRLER